MRSRRSVGRWWPSSPRRRLPEIARIRQLARFRARARRAPPFTENCAPCHGAGGGGAMGYPNLIDDDWLWGGTLDEIALTIRHGVRSGRCRQPRRASMPAFGRDGMLKRGRYRERRGLRALARRASPVTAEAPISQPARRSLPTIAPSATARTARAIASSARPNLTDAIWLYGSDQASIVDGDRGTAAAA